MKNYLKQNEALDTLMVYTTSYANARNHDLDSQLEFLDICYGAEESLYLLLPVQ